MRVFIEKSPAIAIPMVYMHCISDVDSTEQRDHDMSASEVEVENDAYTQVYNTCI